MTLMVSLKPDGSMEKGVVASIAKGLRAGTAYPKDMVQLNSALEPSGRPPRGKLDGAGAALVGGHLLWRGIGLD